MTLFQRLMRSGMPVTWVTIAVGWRGLGAYYGGALIDYGELMAYAAGRLIDPGASNIDPLKRLATSDPGEEDRIEAALGEVAATSGESLECAERKWLVVLVEEQLDQLPPDYLDALCELTSFWLHLEMPPDCPHIIQGRGNDITPTEYYTESNLADILARHLAWLSRERLALGAPLVACKPRA